MRIYIKITFCIETLLRSKENRINELEDIWVDLATEISSLKDQVNILQNDWNTIVNSKITELAGNTQKELLFTLVPESRFEDLKECIAGLSIVHCYKEWLTGNRFEVKAINFHDQIDRNLAIEEFKNMIKCSVSPYVVRPLQLVFNKQYLDILMEDDGDSLNRYWKKYTVNLQGTIKILYYLALGLQDIHKRNFYHGDLKPQSIVIKNGARGPEVKYTNFGSAIYFKDPYELTITKKSCDDLKKYTLGYLAPEIAYFIEQKCIDNVLGLSYSKLDLYALSLVMYSFLTKHMIGKSENHLKNTINPVDYLFFLNLVEHQLRSSLGEIEGYNQGIVQKLVKLIINGLHLNRRKRPKLNEIIEKLHELLY